MTGQILFYNIRSGCVALFSSDRRCRSHFAALTRAAAADAQRQMQLMLSLISLGLVSLSVLVANFKSFDLPLEMEMYRKLCLHEREKDPLPENFAR